MEKSLSENIKAVLSNNRTPLIRGTAMVILSNFLLILNPLVLRQGVLSIDTKTPVDSQPFLHTLFGSFSGQVWPWALLLITISVISAFFKYKMRLEFLSISRNEEKKLRMKVFKRIQMQSMEFFNRHGVGELMSRLTSDISSYRDVLGPGVMYPVYFFTLVIPGIFALYFLSPSLATLSLLPLIFIPLLNLAVRRHIYEASIASKELLAKLSNTAQEDYSGARIIKGYHLEKTMLKRFAELCHKFSKVSIRVDILEGLFYPFLILVTRSVTLLLVLFFGLMTIYSWKIFGAADFVSFMWIQSYIFFPVLMLGWVLPIYQQGKAAYDRLHSIYQEPIKVKDVESALTIPKAAGITFNHLSFQYPGSSRSVLKNISLEIKGGSFIGITGPTGSGKTTLFKLLCREYEVPNGMITIGGHDIHDYPLHAFREEVVSVEQLPFLFSKTIAENVRFGKQEASQDEVEDVASQADLHETIIGFPKGYETIVGERGLTLSGGQKQRIAMARAFLVDKSILLLDDIFSNVDTNTEKKILKTLLENSKGKTLLLISHRVSVLERMERVLFCKGGEIVEDGSPRQLLERGGYYAALSELQQFHTERHP